MNTPRFSRADLAAISAGGVAGATLRWLITRAPNQAGWFTYAPNPSIAATPIEPSAAGKTLVANLLGCLILGAATWLLANRATAGNRRALVAVASGFCGSLTTFSTFAVDAASLLRGSPSQSPWSRGLIYVGVSVIAGAAFFWLGRIAAQRLSGQAT